MDKTINSLKSKDIRLNDVRISKFVDANTIIFIIMGLQVGLH